MEIGIDLGTSGVKVVVMAKGKVLAASTVKLEVSLPCPRWSEQDPLQWWVATEKAIFDVRSQVGQRWGSVRAIGLSGQMHGAVLLDAADRVLRPAILWNDARSDEECRLLEQVVTESRRITGNIAMPGFTAPKLLWVRKHEPQIFAQVAHVLLPKDWLRLKLTGNRMSEMSDASGTLWLDVGARRWSELMLTATGLDLNQMPSLVEGTEPTGVLRPDLASQWGLGKGVLVAGGAGDNAASAIGMGAVEPGDGFISMGTSGVVFVVSDGFAPNPDDAVHAMCHAIPDRWHQMSVILSAAASLRWFSCVVGGVSEEKLSLMAEGLDSVRRLKAPLFQPYLSGERTPHNDSGATAAFVGLTASHTTADLAYAVMEGVAFALSDGVDALRKTGSRVDELTLVGGGSRSLFWAQLVANVANVSLSLRVSGDIAAARGAAQLAARCCDSGLGPAFDIPPSAAEIVPEFCGLSKERLHIYRALYPVIRRSL